MERAIATASPSPSGVFGPLPGYADLFAGMAMRLAAVVAETVFVRADLAAYVANPRRVSLLLVLVSEVITLVAILLPRAAIRRDTSLIALALIPPVYCYAFFLVVVPSYHPAREIAAVIVQGVGLVWVIASKLTLGRAFGLLPADRGLTTSGPYRVIRHPIYLGYLILHIGFLMENPVLRNLAVLTVLYVVQYVRILREEALLGAREDYRTYCGRVRFRMIPCLF